MLKMNVTSEHEGVKTMKFMLRAAHGSKTKLTNKNKSATLHEIYVMSLSLSKRQINH